MALQVRVQPSHSLSLLQMDCLQLQGAAVPPAHSRPALLSASAVPEQIFCILQRGEASGSVPAGSSTSVPRMQRALNPVMLPQLHAGCRSTCCMYGSETRCRC